MVLFSLTACLVNHDLYEQRLQELLAEEALAQDDDQDGYSENDGDCDDTDPAIHPEADEWCDGKDQDCDNEVDEDAVDRSEFWVDADGDGFGAGASEQFCEATVGFVGNSDDCDDSNSDIHPEAKETWYDGVDQDCDLADDFDADGDGDSSDSFGGSDCNDTDPTVYGGGSEGWWDIGVDNDCDGSIEDQLVVEANVAVQIIGPEADAAFGAHILTVPDGWMGTDGYVLVSATGLDSYSGGMYGWQVGGLEGSISTDGADVAVFGEPSEFLGGSLTWAGTLENPVMVAAAVTFGGSLGEIRGWTSHGPVTLTDDPTFTITGQRKDSFVGGPSAAETDLDGDGVYDLIVSSISDDRMANDAGSVAVFLDPSELRAGLSYEDFDALYTTDVASSGLSPLTTNDMDGDGEDDLAFYAPGDVYPDPDGMLLYNPPLSGTHNIHAIGDALLLSSKPGATVDIDSDGALELLARHGKVAQYDLPTYGTVTPWNDALADSGFKDPKSYATLVAGRSPPWDGSRFISASHAHQGEQGVVVIDTLRWQDSTDFEDAKYQMLGEQAGDLFGSALSIVDFNSDGVLDMLVGAPGNDANGPNSGAIYLVPGIR